MSIQSKRFKNQLADKFRRQYLMAAFLCFISHAVLAQPPVGMITNLEGPVSFVEQPEKTIDFGTDILYSTKIQTGKNASLMLTYYMGCRQEWFGEDTLVQVDKDKSKVLKGKLLKHAIYDCETPEIIMSEKDSFKKAAFHFRNVSSDNNSSHALTKKQSEKERVNFKLWTIKKDNHAFRLGESIVFYMIADRDVYLKLDYFQADEQVVHLIPNFFKNKEKLKAHTIHSIGGNKSELNLTVGRPYGKESVRALVSTSPFPESFSSNKISESGYQYDKKLSQLIEEQGKDLSLYEFSLDFKTMP